MLFYTGFSVDEGGHHGSEGDLPVLNHLGVVRESCNYLLHNIEGYLSINYTR
jgi:hypothetical protein